MKFIVILIQIVLIACCYYWIATHIDWKIALHECQHVNIIFFCLVLIQRYVPYIGLGLRLSILFKRRVSFFTCFKASILCVGCNNVFPARMGELVKIAWLQGSTNLRYAILCGNIFLERLLDVTCLLFLTALFAAEKVSGLVGGVLAGALFFAWGLIGYCACNTAIVHRLFSILPIGKSIRDWCSNVALSITNGVTRRRIGALVSASIFIWAMNFTHVALLANGLLGLGLSFPKLGLLCVTIFFSSALLLAPGGIGVMEMGVVMVLQFMGIDSVSAAVTAVFVRIFYSLPALAGAIWVVVHSRREFFACLWNIHKRHSLNAE